MAPASAWATSLPVRTFDLARLGPTSSTIGAVATDPVISADGATIAYDAPVSGARREVYALNVFTGARTLISSTKSGAPAAGNSTSPSISATGGVVAFVSSSSTLAPGASHHATNIYARRANGTMELVSGGRNGATADGSATQPEVSGNGRYVAFTSAADNLVAAHVEHTTNVYVHDLRTGKTTLVSVGRTGRGGDAWSSNPAIDASGSMLSFDSAAHNLQGSPGGSVPQVYVRNLHAHRTMLVSETSGGVAQDAAQPRPFRQVSSISADGSTVVFDSLADNLVRDDINRRSDIFVHSLSHHSTILISENNDGYEGNSDSFSPTISADGTAVAFESYGTNLAHGGGPSANVFVRDLTLRTTSVIDVGPAGLPPSRERTKQLLQRPDLSAHGEEAVFESTALSLTRYSIPQVHSFLRFMAPPVGSISSTTVAHGTVTVKVGADDPAARSFLCRLDGGAPFECRPPRIELMHLAAGRHTLTLRAGGAGMLYSPTLLSTTFRVP